MIQSVLLINFEYMFIALRQPKLKSMQKYLIACMSSQIAEG